uniref:Small ribosomal subunit protein uS8c n=1 Tax=Schizaea pectinata TaxID=148576 RepID=A0A286QHL3_9MONI|nr:ribosomal protein S8 [Schizaea pectinata]APT66095.1 ribosomal protein S8 [Schizaea pectinata]
MTNDLISTTIVTPQNANMKKGSIIRIPATRVTRSIGHVSSKEGFVKSITEHRENVKYYSDIVSRYKGRKRKSHIAAVRRVSRPGLRIHFTHRRAPKVMGGVGIAILPTSEGLLTDREARRRKIGGEILCHVY